MTITSILQDDDDDDDVMPSAAREAKTIILSLPRPSAEDQQRYISLLFDIISPQSIP
jgi:hypothetical protein